MHYTGTEQVVFNIASMMRKMGHNVKVITYSFYEESFYDSREGEILSRSFSYKGIDVLALRHRKIPAELDIHLRDNALAGISESIISRERPDIVHVGHSMRISELIFASKKLGIPYMFTLTDFWLICPRFTLINSHGDLCAGPEDCSACRANCPELSAGATCERLAEAKHLLGGASTLTAPSGFLAGIFNNELPSLDIKVIRHGLRHAFLKKNRRQYLKDDIVTLGYCGSLNVHKGVHIAIEAVRRTKSDRLRLVIYGSGDPVYTARLQTMAQGDPRIEFCGIFTDSQAADVFSMIDVVVIPSLWFETYVLTIREAFLCSIPVIASNVGVMSEAVSDGINGFTFRIGDPEHLREVIEKILSDTTILNSLKAGVGQDFIPTVEQEACAYNSIYNGHRGMRSDSAVTGPKVEKQ
jgi:glycosyltransferase involved in cell wall biosynthesis